MLIFAAINVLNYVAYARWVNISATIIPLAQRKWRASHFCTDPGAKLMRFIFKSPCCPAIKNWSWANVDGKKNVAEYWIRCMKRRRFSCTTPSLCPIPTVIPSPNTVPFREANSSHFFLRANLSRYLGELALQCWPFHISFNAVNARSAYLTIVHSL